MNTMTVTYRRTQDVPARRYLTDPKEISAFRRRQSKKIARLCWHGLKRLPGKAIVGFNRVVAQVTLMCAFFAAWLGILGISIWSLTYILERCTVNW